MPLKFGGLFVAVSEVETVAVTVVVFVAAAHSVVSSERSVVGVIVADDDDAVPEAGAENLLGLGYLIVHCHHYCPSFSSRYPYRENASEYQ